MGSHCTSGVQMEEQMDIRSIWRGCGAILAVGLFALPAAAGPHIPRINDVALSGSAGTYTAVITGTNFGVAPGGIPCSSCSPLQLQVSNMTSQPQQESINVTDWSDTSITVTGIAANKGDGLRIALYNQTAGNVDTWGGRVGPNVEGASHITTITTSGSGATLTVTITGSGFGAAPDGLMGQNTDSPYLVFSDWNADAPGTDGFPWNAGFCGTNDCNGVTVAYQSWTDTQVVLSGFGSEYGMGNWTANPRDAFCVGIWPSTSTSNGTTGGAVKCRRVSR
jgi:hypothetical protein